MSQRVKRPNRSDDGSVPTKRRKRPTAEEEEAATLAAAWHPRPLNDFKSIYNRTTTEAPAELFRKDLISAMKLPDSEPLASHEYWVIADQWKQEWERGVQVPVNPDSLPEPSVTVTHCASAFKPQNEFKLPKNKYIRITKDDRFKAEEHSLSNAPAQAEAACSYDLDECDVAWLRLMNEERTIAGLNCISEDQLERVLERLELRCWDKIQSILRNEEGLGIEYDENVICDVCRSPDSEEGNEMVFCDSCNICVHQACYGITRIPDGQWLCCTCALSKRPECVLCPNKGGAMKSTRSGKHWAHVSCALWIPEVSIGCVEKMEPITKVSSIPQSRWALICVLCRERVGACIQCSVKTCKTAYHVTCAFKHGLEMRAIIEDENADDGVKLRSYCEKHSKSSKKEKSVCSGSEDDDSKRRKRKDMTSEEKNQARAARLQEIESEFYKHVSIKDLVHLDVDAEALQYVYNYWKLKRKAGNNKPLLPPKFEDVDMLSHKQEQADLEKMKMFVQLRQDLERVRNLCYMVSRREKLSRTFFRMREQTFHKQAAVLASGSQTLSAPVIQAVIEANHGPSIYDRLYSHSEAEDHTSDFEVVLARIAGLKSPQYDANDKKKSECNGVFKDVKNNPYKKLYFNGSSKRRSVSLYGSSMSSASSGDERPKDNKENHMRSSSEEEKSTERKKAGTVHKRAVGSKAAERRQKRLSLASKTKVDSSSEEEVKDTTKDWNSYSKSSLKQMENELGISGSDSDDLMPMRTSKHSDGQKAKAISSIYSDSDSTDASVHNDDKSSNTASDSQQSKLRTKAAVKEFSQKPSTSKVPNKSSSENKKKAKDEPKKEIAVKKQDYVPSDLIVPQRQAAKKASENMKSTTTTRIKDQPVSNDQENKTVNEEKLKGKSKPKAVKEVKETKDGAKKEVKTDVFELDVDKVENQEILAYVPQRQAAKKATEHIKSLGKPGTIEAPNENEKSKTSDLNKMKKETESKKKEPEEKLVAGQDNKRKSSSNSSMSSSSSSSTDSSSSSCSESEDEPAKPQSESLFSSQSREPAKRTSAKDWPFLVKDAKSRASSSSSDSSDSSCSVTPVKPPIVSKSKTDSPKKQEPARIFSKSGGRKATDKKPTPPEREEPAPGVQSKGRRRGRPRTSNSGDRIRDANVRVGNISDSQRSSVEGDRCKVRKGKSDDMEERYEKEGSKPTELLSPIRKTDKKLNEKSESSINNLEREILERKAGRDGYSNKMKSTIDRLFGVPDTKEKDVVNFERQKASEKTKKEQKSEEKSIKPPEKISKLADKISNVPEKMHKSHEKTTKNVEKTCNKLLDKANKSPDKSIKSPERAYKLSEKVSKSQDKLIKSPGKVSKAAVEKVPDSPEKSSRSSIPDKIKLPERENTPAPLESKNVSTKKSSAKPKGNEEAFSKKSLTSNSSIDSTEQNNGKKHPSKQNFELTKPTVLEEQKIFVESHNMESTDDKKLQMKPVVHNRSIFSPQPHDKESDLLEEFDNILNDGFAIAKDEILKGSVAFNFTNVPLFKDDSKEDSARETLNLVEKLRMELSKKSTAYDVDDSSVSSSTKNENDRIEYAEQIVPNNVVDSSQVSEMNVEEQPHATNNVQMRVEASDLKQQFEQEKTQDFRYIANDCASVSNNVNVTSIQHQHLDHSCTQIQADERWVPPSENYPNMQAVNPNHSVSDIEQPYLQSFESPHLSHPLNDAASVVNTVLPAQLDTPVLPQQLNANVEDDLHKNQSPSIHDRKITQTPFLDPASMDCIASPSPYADIHPQAKWADSQVMPNRRSSSSSAGSTSSTSSRRNNDEEELLKRQEMLIMNHSLEMPYSVLPQSIPPFPPNTIENFPPFSEASQFRPVTLFPPPNINNHLTFPSSGTTMFPPPFAATFPAPHSVINPLPKPVEDAMHFPSPCTAAFTSSQHNLALTAAMVNPFPPVPKEVVQNEQDVPPSDAVQTPTEIPTMPTSEEVAASPNLSISTPNSNHVQESPDPSVKSNSSAGKKSPSKPTRTSARFLSQQSKSPSKSPGKSPQEPSAKSNSVGRGRGENKRGSGKASTGRGAQIQMRGRGRGRGRGRAGGHTQHSDYDFVNTNTIHNKLVGTVYDLDFDDDISSESMGDLRAMRERRKSVDIHERKSETQQHISKDSSQSPKFSSPSQASHKRSYNADLRELRPPTPIDNVQLKTDVRSTPISGCEVPQTFPDIVLPGPVDMRTYNSNFDSQTYNETNLLRAFSTGAPEQQIQEIDEDFEKELQSALTNNYKKSENPPVPEISNIKVSLSDSRNQLKVKIKGPIANYTSTVVPLQPVVSDPVSNVTSNSVSNSSLGSGSITINPGTSNLRRMRKKELLRQYCSQDMNMDDPTATSGLSATPAAPSINRTIITIPKAVASMTSIPTKDDYRDYRTGADDVLENKLRKEKSRPINRELRHLDLLDDDGNSERRRSLGGLGANNFTTNFDSPNLNKRRGRPPRLTQTTPKLKIRISGNSVVGGSNKVEDKKDAIRPPKKRFPTIVRPSVEDLKRESMKFRKQVMADFGVERRKRKDKSRKKKKKKKQEVQIISNESTNTKLIIRFSKKTDGESDIKRTSAGDNNVCISAELGASVEQTKNEVKDNVRLKTSPSGVAGSDQLISDGAKALRMVRTNKVTPIKLKLSRCQEGSGYIMRTNATVTDSPKADNCEVPPTPQPPPLNVPEPLHSTTPLPLNKDCEVR